MGHKESRTISRLRESVSAFVPFFLSNRTQSRLPTSQSSQNLFHHVEYLHTAPSLVHSETTEQSDPRHAGWDQSQNPAAKSVNSHHNSNMPRPALPRAQISSSQRSVSASSSTGQSRNKQSQHHSSRTRTRPAQTRKIPSSKPRGTHAQTRPSRAPRRKITAFTRLRMAVESKFRLTLSFGLAFVAALVLYLGLFISHTSSGATFHALSILLLISLAVIFIHSLFRFLALNTDLKAARAHRAGLKKTPSARGWNISRPLPNFASSDVSVDEKVGTADGGYENDEFPVFHQQQYHRHQDPSATNYGTDYEHNPYDHDIEAGAGAPNHGYDHTHGPPPVVYPPPVYGNTRTSVVRTPSLIRSPCLPFPSLNPKASIANKPDSASQSIPQHHPPLQPPNILNNPHTSQQTSNYPNLHTSSPACQAGTHPPSAPKVVSRLCSRSVETK